MLASEELEPGHGWDYRRLRMARDNSKTSGDAMARELMAGFKQQAIESGTDKDITLSLIDLHEMAQLGNAISSFADALKTNAPMAAGAIGSSAAGTVAFGKAPDPAQATNMIDIGDFAISRSTSLRSRPTTERTTISCASSARGATSSRSTTSRTSVRCRPS